MPARAYWLAYIMTSYVKEPIGINRLQPAFGLPKPYVTDISLLIKKPFRVAFCLASIESHVKMLAPSLQT